MEVVNAGTISVDNVIESLLDPNNLKQFIGRHGALCFALVREMTAPGFYGHLIENSATIDSTTREHIAFIVFYGDRSGIAHPVNNYTYHRYQVQGFSVSENRDIEVESIPSLQVRPEFDPRLGDQFRYSPSQVDRPTLSQKMSQASRSLMERYSVPEEALPCLLFVDASDPTKWMTVRLSFKDPLQSLYNHALRPISQEFADLSRFWKRRDEIKGSRYRLERANAEVRDLPGKISECNDRLDRSSEDAKARYAHEVDQWRAIEETIRGRYEDPSVLSAIEHHPVAWLVIGKLKSYQNRLVEAKSIEDSRLVLSQNQASTPAQLSMERARIVKRLAVIRQSIESKSANVTTFVKDAIGHLENAIRGAHGEFNSATSDKENLERSLREAKAFLDQHNSATLAVDEELLADLERSLRTRGYSDDVLADSCPSAFSVIKSLQDRKLLGTNEGISDSRGHNTMRILFLAANPLQTASLDLEEELRSLEQELRGVKFRESVTLIAKHAVRPDDLVLHVRAHKPNVIHFSGHGSTAGIILRDDKGEYQAVEGAALKRFLEGRGVDLVVLNACYSTGQADTIHGAVKTVVGTTDAVGDQAARRFTVAFYRSLGNGLSVRDAFRDGSDAVALHGLDDVFRSGGDLDLTLVSEVERMSPLPKPEPPLAMPSDVLPVQSNDLLTGPLTISAVLKAPEGQVVGDAYPTGDNGVHFVFSLFNGNSFDFLVNRLAVDVLGYAPLNLDHLVHGVGATAVRRYFRAIIRPERGSYVATYAGSHGEFVTIPPGKSEGFDVEISTRTEGLYDICLRIHGSSAGKRFDTPLHSTNRRVAFFDRAAGYMVDRDGGGCLRTTSIL